MNCGVLGLRRTCSPLLLAAGAAALVVEAAVETRKGVVTILAEDASAALAQLCEAW